MTYQDKIKKSYHDNRIVIICSTLLILTYALIWLFQPKGSQPSESKVLAADTIIPAGMVLVPIELENIDSIRGLINGYGYIDLYVADSPQSPRRKIGHRIKILQAPLNPREFAVLVSESASREIMQTAGFFTGVVQNRSQVESQQDGEIVVARTKKTKEASLSIEYSETE